MMKAKYRTRRLCLEYLEDRTVLDTLRLLGNLANNSWFDPNNWDKGKVPGAGDTAILGFTSDDDIQLVQAGLPKDATVSHLILEDGYIGTLRMDGARLTVKSTFTMRNGTIVGTNGFLSLNDSANLCYGVWASGTIKDVLFQVGNTGGQGTTFL